MKTNRAGNIGVYGSATFVIVAGLFLFNGISGSHTESIVKSLFGFFTFLGFAAGWLACSFLFSFDAMNKHSVRRGQVENQPESSPTLPNRPSV